MNYWEKNRRTLANRSSPFRSVTLWREDAQVPAQDSTCINWREASKSSTGYILIRKNFIPIIKLMMLWTIYGLCSLCRNSLSSAINFFFTAGNLRRGQEWFVKWWVGMWGKRRPPTSRSDGATDGDPFPAADGQWRAFCNSLDVWDLVRVQSRFFPYSTRRSTSPSS